MPAIVDTLRYVLELDDKGFRAEAARVDQSVVGLGNSIRTILTGALAGLATAFTAVKIGEFIKDATLTAARTQVLGTALDQVSRNADISRGYIALLEQEMKALGITTQESRASIIKFIQSGLPLEKVTRLARLAQDAAVVANINSSESFERLIRGIQTGQIELIRSAGVFISIEQELNRFAKSAGKARQDITDLERQTAILNAVLAQGDKLAGNYEAAMGDVGKQLTSLPRHFEEAKNAIGEVFLPVLENMVETAKDLSVALREAFTNDAILEFEEFLKSLGDKKIVPGSSLAIDAQLELNKLQIAVGKARNELERIQKVEENWLTRSDKNAEIRSKTRELKALTDAYEALKERITGAGAAAEQQKQADAITAAQNAKLKERADLLARIQQVPPALDIPVTIRMETSDEALMRQILGQDLGPNEISVIVDLDDQNFRNELEAAIAETEQKFQRILRPVLTQEFPGGEMSAITQEADRLASLQEAADITKQKFAEAFRNVQTIASSVFRAIAGEAGQVLDDILGALGNFATGNIAGGIAGIISGFAGIFSSTTDTTNRLILSNRDLIRAINDWRDSIFRLTDQEKAEQADAARQFLDLVNRRPGGRSLTPGEREEARSWLEDAGIPIPAGATWEQLVEIARSILAGIGDMTVSFDAIQAADTSAERTDLIRGVKSFSEGLTVLQGLIDLFDLSPEEQLKMWQDAFRIWGESGLLSDEDKLWLANKMDDLKDSIDRQPQGATQTERSIARITERQADTLVSALSTLDLHLREGFQNLVEAFNNWTAEAFGRVSDYNAATVGMGGVTVGPVYIQPKTATGEEIAAEFTKVVERELRAAGGLMLK